MTYNIQNLIEHFQIFSKSSKKTNIRDIREVTTHSINYVSLCSANQLHLWTMHASYHIIDFDLAKAEKKFTTHHFFHFLVALWNCIVHQPKTLSQPVRQSVASQPFNQSAFSQSLSHSIIEQVGLSMKHFDNVNWAILSLQISQSVGEPNSKLPASQSVIPSLS